MLSYTGPFSIYFNRHVDAPRVWIVASIDQQWEVNVVSIEMHALMRTRYEPRERRADHNGPPSAWFEGEGVVEVDSQGRATIKPLPSSSAS